MPGVLTRQGRDKKCSSSKYAGVTQLVEYRLPKPVVAGSSPVARSKCLSDNDCVAGSAEGIPSEKSQFRSKNFFFPLNFYSKSYILVAQFLELFFKFFRSFIGRLAQLVQSTCLTSRGSLVRIHERPHTNK